MQRLSRSMTRADVELLDVEAWPESWDVPLRLTSEACRDHTGDEGRQPPRTEAALDDDR